jgi:hypothetical protein
LGFLEYKTYSRGMKWEISTISFNCSMFSDVRYLAAISKWSSLQYDNSIECLTSSSNIWNFGCLIKLDNMN